MRALQSTPSQTSVEGTHVGAAASLPALAPEGGAAFEADASSPSMGGRSGLTGRSRLQGLGGGGRGARRERGEHERRQGGVQ